MLLGKKYCHEDPKCCFAQYEDLDGNLKCRILSETYPPGKCKFKKADREYTDGVRYPFDPFYGSAFKPGKEKEAFE